MRDVKATEELYLKLRPWIDNHPNLGVYSDTDTPICPKCGSDDVINGRRASARSSRAHTTLRLPDCGGWARGKVMQLPLGKRRSLLVPE